MKDMNILLMQRDYSGFASPIKRALINPREKRTGTGRLRHQLETKEGTIEFKTGDSDGLVECCTQAFSASPDASARISLRITIKQPSAGGESSDKSEGGSDVKKLSLHSSLISADLTRFEQRTNDLSSNADQAREWEKQFHGQSVKLNRAVKYWPMFRMVVLAIGAYVQVSHVIRYMKSRHIY